MQNTTENVYGTNQGRGAGPTLLVATKRQARLVWISYGVTLLLYDCLNNSEAVRLQLLNRFWYDIAASRVRFLLKGLDAAFPYARLYITPDFTNISSRVTVNPNDTDGRAIHWDNGC